MAVKMEAHPSVTQWEHAFPARTAWCERAGAASWGRLTLGLVLLAALMAVMGWAQFSSRGLLPPWPQLGAAFDANLDFQRWQLSLSSVEDWAAQARGFARPRLALLLDLALIATWASVLAPWFCRAFARHAGLIQVGMAPPAWLNRAGWALAAAVGADIAEDLLSVLALAVAGHGMQPLPPELLAWAVRLPLLAASAAKWLALGAVALLILSSLLRRHRKLATPRPAMT